MKGFEKFTKYIADNDFDYKQVDVHDIIDFIYNFDNDDLSGLQSMLMIVEVLREIENKHNIDINLIIENNFRKY